MAIVILLGCTHRLFTDPWFQLVIIIVCYTIKLLIIIIIIMMVVMATFSCSDHVLEHLLMPNDLNYKVNFPYRIYNSRITGGCGLTVNNLSSHNFEAIHKY